MQRIGLFTTNLYFLYECTYNIFHQISKLSFNFHGPSVITEGILYNCTLKLCVYTIKIIKF